MLSRTGYYRSIAKRLAPTLTLVADIGRLLRNAFANRVLPFDSKAACAYADIAARHRTAGHPVPYADGQIAAIALSCGMAVAMRNVRDFQNMGIELVNPWTVGAG